VKGVDNSSVNTPATHVRLAGFISLSNDSADSQLYGEQSHRFSDDGHLTLTGDFTNYAVVGVMAIYRQPPPKGAVEKCGS